MKLWQKLTDLFDNGVAQEMNKRYKDTILCIVANDKKYYANYRGVDETGFHIFYDKEKQKIQLAENTECDVLVPRLEAGCYNTPNGVVHVSPSPARQWKRGLTRGNTNLIQLVNTLSGMLGANNFEGHIYDVLDEEKQQEVTMDGALGGARTYGSYALNRNFAVMIDPKTDTDSCYLFYQCYIVGKIDGYKISVLNDAFRQELLDNQRKLFPNYEVI